MDLGSMIVNELIKALIPIIVGALVVYVTKQLIPSVIEFIDSKIDATQRKAISDIINMAAHSTEAARIRALLEQVAFDALSYAVKIADDGLARAGIELDDEAIKAQLLAELHKLRIFTDIESETAPLDDTDSTVDRTAEGVDQTDENAGRRAVLPMSAGAPPRSTLAQRKSLMWL